MTSWQHRLHHFAHMESAGGLCLMAATVAAMLVKNSALSGYYADFLGLVGQVRVGSVDIEKPLFLWVNDLWMAIFFFLVGLEIRREVTTGQLRDRRQLILPVSGAVGGVIVPALIFLAFNWSDPQSRAGWAIPTATDIAFALGVLSLLGSRVPMSLKLFLMTLAILDDLIAIIVIALFYTAGLSTTSIIAAAVVLTVMLGLRVAKVYSYVPYLLLGAVLWVCVLKSGVHATLAGVVTALLLPGEPPGSERSRLDTLIHGLHPWVAFLVLPAFAFVNAGIDFSELRIEKLVQTVPLGVFFGLFAGKLVGVFVFAGLCIRLGWSSLPTGANWAQLLGVSALCGIGFTMSLFIGGLAYAEIGVGYARIDRFAIILASLASAVLGCIILYLAGPRPGHDQPVGSTIR